MKQSQGIFVPMYRTCNDSMKTRIVIGTLFFYFKVNSFFSYNCVVIKLPTICTAAMVIEATNGSIFEAPAFSKIIKPYVTKE